MTLLKSENSSNLYRGFTIVELLIVIVVIGILAAITIVSYTGIQQSAGTSALKSDLRQAATYLEIAKMESGVYDTSDSSGTGIPKSQDTTYRYTTDGSTYCLTAYSPQAGAAFNLNSTTGQIQEGVCAGHTVPTGEEPQNQGIVTTLAGSTSGYADGIGANAQFNYPYGLVVDGSGVVYVADGNQTIRKITPNGTVTTIAGQNDESGYVNGTGSTARFSYIYGIAVDALGNLYVGDSDNNRIRKINPSLYVSTLAGSTYGYLDGEGETARLGSPRGVAVDNMGNVYVADNHNSKIRKITPSGTVTTLAGSTYGFANGSGASAQFRSPYDVAVDANGYVYVADESNHRIRKISPSGEVTTLAGSSEGYADGVGADAQFAWPLGVCVDGYGNVYVADMGNDRVRKITPNGTVTTVAGSTDGYDDGVGLGAQFSQITDIAVDNEGNLYVADESRIRKIE